MKQVFLLILILLVGTSAINAQRHLSGQWGIQITGGTVDGLRLRSSGSQWRTNFSLAYFRNNPKLTRWVSGITYMQKDFGYGRQVIPVAQLTAEAGYFVPLLSDRGRNVCLSAGLSATVGYETSNWGDKILYDGATLMSRDRFLWGASLTAELEVFITDRLIFLMNIKEHGLAGSSIGSFHMLGGIGIKLIIN